MQLSAADRERIEKARNDYGLYYLSINPGYSYVPYQQECIVPALQEIESGDNDRLIILIHAGASKTRLCTAGFAPWVLGRRPDRQILVISYDDKSASEFRQTVRDHLNSEIHHLVFPWCELKGATQATSYFQTTQGGKIYTAGWGGAIARIRADYVLIDDPLKNSEEATSESIMEGRMRLLNSVVKDRLKPGGKILICTHRLAPRDFVGRILEKEAQRWKIVCLQAEPAPDSIQAKYLEPGTKYLWEKYFGVRKYEDAKSDQWAWETTYQQRPERALPQRFEVEWLRYYTDRINPGRFHTGMIVDPALAKGKLADRSSIMVLAGGGQINVAKEHEAPRYINQILLADWVLDRLDPAERTRAVIKLADKWEVDWILWEEVGMSSDSFYLDQEIEAFGLNCPVIPIGRRGPRHNWSKHQRIMQLIPDFKEGRIVLPNELIYKQRDGQKVDLIRYFVESEYRPYAGPGSLAHDEGLDTLSRIHEEAFQLQYEEGVPQSEDEEGEREGGQFEGMAGGRGSWFARF